MLLQLVPRILIQVNSFSDGVCFWSIFFFIAVVLFRMLKSDDRSQISTHCTVASSWNLPIS